MSEIQPLTRQPLFIVFEGIDGAGTTTQSRRLYEDLRQGGHSPILTREPGGTPLAERIRALVLDPAAGDVDDVTELLLYAASRRQHVTELIAPNLANGKPVISDRYASSTVAYQGVGRGLGVELAHTVNAIATGPTVPDITICLDLPIESAWARRQTRGGMQDRLEQAGQAFQRTVRDAYVDLARDNDDRWVLVDAEIPMETLQRQIRHELDARFPDFPFRSRLV